LHNAVLVVDDDDGVRAIIGAVLERLGYVALIASDGAEAMRLFNQHLDTIQVVLLDLTMPGLSGEATLQQMRALKPTQRVIVISGYSPQDTKERCVALGGPTEFMPKPFEIKTLISKLSPPKPTVSPG